MGLGEAAVLAWGGFRVIFYHVLDGHCDFVARGVREADVEDCVFVVFCHGDGVVYCFDDVWVEEVSVSEDSDRGAVSLEELSVLGELGEFELGEGHEGVDFVAGSLEVFDAEGVYCDGLDATFVADFYDLC